MSAVRSPQWRVRRLRRASALGLYARRGEFRSGVPYREALLGQRFCNGNSIRRARIRLGKIAAIASLRRASPRQSCFGENPQEARVRVYWKCLLRANRLDASVLRLQSTAPETEHFHSAEFLLMVSASAALRSRTFVGRAKQINYLLFCQRESART